MTSISEIDIIDIYVQDGKELWDGMEDFCCGMKENSSMEYEKISSIPFHPVLSHLGHDTKVSSQNKKVS